MRGIYIAQYDISSLSTSKTLMLVQASSSSVLEIYSAEVTNRSNETNEQWDIALYRTTTYGSPTGTSVTAGKCESLDSASAATILASLSGEPTAYSAAVIDKQGISSLGGYFFEPIPELRPIIAPSVALGLKIINAPAASDVSVKIVYREIG